MRDHPRQEPGAVIPPAGIRAGGGGSTAVPTATSAITQDQAASYNLPPTKQFEFRISGPVSDFGFRISDFPQSPCPSSLFSSNSNPLAVSYC